MRILAIHNFHRNGSASGDDQVFKSETKLLEDHGNEVIRYTVCNDEFDNLGILGKVISVFGMLWLFALLSNTFISSDSIWSVFSMSLARFPFYFVQ